MESVEKQIVLVTELGDRDVVDVIDVSINRLTEFSRRGFVDVYLRSYLSSLIVNLQSVDLRGTIRSEQCRFSSLQILRGNLFIQNPFLLLFKFRLLAQHFTGSIFKFF